MSVDAVSVFAGGRAAHATFTLHDKFAYKGTPNDDLAKYSATLELADGREGLEVPEPDEAVRVGRAQRRAGDGQRRDDRPVLADLAQRAPVLDVPGPQRPVAAAGKEPPPT